MSVIRPARLIGSFFVSFSSKLVLNRMKFSSLSVMYWRNSVALCFREKLSGSSPSGKSNTFTFMPSASSISVLLILAFIPASSPSYNKVILDVNRCNKRICSSDSAVPELATTFSKPHWCMAMTSVYPSTIYTQSFLTIALLAW